MTPSPTRSIWTRATTKPSEQLGAEPSAASEPEQRAKYDEDRRRAPEGEGALVISKSLRIMIPPNARVDPAKTLSDAFKSSSAPDAHLGRALLVGGWAMDTRSVQITHVNVPTPPPAAARARFRRGARAKTERPRPRTAANRGRRRSPRRAAARRAATGETRARVRPPRKTPRGWPALSSASIARRPPPNTGPMGRRGEARRSRGARPRVRRRAAARFATRFARSPPSGATPRRSSRRRRGGSASAS